MKNPKPFMLVKAHKYDESGASDDIIVKQKSGGGAADEALFAILKDLNKKTAKAQNLPPYVVFQEPSLEDMATRYPITMEELTNIAGVGQGKANKFGKPFIDVIKKYVEDNDIERPDDMVVKSIVNKSGLKVFVIQSIDAKRSLEDIARAKGKEVDDILTEIERIVSSGTKLNINYLLDELLDEEYQEEIIDFMREMESDSMQEIFDEFDDVYSEEELRLVRVKFISEMGN